VGVKQSICEFGGKVIEVSGADIPEKEAKFLLGGKGAGLVKMSRRGIPIPPGFILTTEVCKKFNELGDRLPAGLEIEIGASMKRLEEKMGRKFGDPKDPFLVSIRSGGPVSMPGMMDTILNLGLTEAGVQGLAQSTSNERFAWDTYRRFIQMFGEIVLEVPANEFDTILNEERTKAKVVSDIEVPADSIRRIAGAFKELIRKKTGHVFSDEPKKHLLLAIEAVFRSWNNRRAMKYREIHQIPNHYGTGVVVQAMVFGNYNGKSGTGVVFTRNPSTGRKGLFGEYLMQAQGEDIVAGIRTPQPINRESAPEKYSGITMQYELSEAYSELARYATQVENFEREMQDMEFTVQEGRLWILQTRRGKRTARAALNIATDMVHEGMLTREGAVLRMAPEDLDHLLHPVFSPNAKRVVLAKGLPASPGAASGKIVFTADEAEQMAKNGEKVILVRDETSPEDIHGMQAAKGILTCRGGMTSHAAVVARGMGKCCIVGCAELEIDSTSETMETPGGKKFGKGDVISLDGSTGEVLDGAVLTVEATSDPLLEELLSWADDIRKLGVRANADTPKDCRTARQFGAQGVGLCRTEHMFFEKNRINWVRQMILAETKEERVKFLEKLFPFQLEDFRAIFHEMAGLPVTIRLLDPPLHEFLPRKKAEITSLAKRLEIDSQELSERIERLHEFNPMLGHRGCRLAVTYPEIYEMQVRAIMTAAVEEEMASKNSVLAEIMIPLVMNVRELEIVKKLVIDQAEAVQKTLGHRIRYWVGTMIELPRAAIVAKEIAERVDFFSFGTNDLTQTVLGLSRDDSSRFIPAYKEAGIFQDDPFASIDKDGVLEFVKLGIERGRSGKAKLKIGVCGEHGGDPASIKEFHSAGVDYVSCSPLRIPIARLTAAQAVLKNNH
jgi:pyruvate, orthophosphate dikinase